MSIATFASNKLGIIMNALVCLVILSWLTRCFWSFLHPVLENCSPVCMSAAASHLSLLDCVMSKEERLGIV